MAKKSTQIKSIKELYDGWFVQYASYVALHRAIPYIDDGLKPVQRRILHSFKEKDNGSRNKIASVVGKAMDYHPHGDMSLFGAIINLGQKNYLIDPGGNWGDPRTGAPAAAGRYIEGRLSKLALETSFNPKLTEWIPNYDGTLKEPVHLPVKFPLLLCQGAEGIAVGLSSIILPHNFCEVIAACISSLKDEPYELYPDLPGGGIVDASSYQDGKSGGKILSRATFRSESKSLHVIGLPYNINTEDLAKSIVKANDDGKIKIKKVTDLTSEEIDIEIETVPGQDHQELIAALYSFTKCESSVSPTAVVIKDKLPAFLSVHEILDYNAQRTKQLLQRELEILIEELNAKWHKLTLERIFVEKEIYLRIRECKIHDEALLKIGIGLQPYINELRDEITQDDLENLTKIQIRRIGAYDADQNKRDIESVEEKAEEARKKIARINSYTIKYFEGLLAKYGQLYPRKSEISQEPFNKILGANVALANTKVYWQAEQGFVGVGNSLKKEGEILPFEVNDLTDIAALSENGILKVNRPTEKTFYSEKLLDCRPLPDKEGKNPPVFNLIYLDYETKTVFAKRFDLTGGFTRDKIYQLAGENPKNKILFLFVQEDPTKNPEPKIKVKLKDAKGLRKTEIEIDFKELLIKNKGAKGNTVTKNEVKSVSVFK